MRKNNHLRRPFDVVAGRRCRRMRRASCIDAGAPDARGGNVHELPTSQHAEVSSDTCEEEPLCEKMIISGARSMSWPAGVAEERGQLEPRSPALPPGTQAPD